jgi:hypothetical protein
MIGKRASIAVGAVLSWWSAYWADRRGMAEHSAGSLLMRVLLVGAVSLVWTACGSDATPDADADSGDGDGDGDGE